jgi:hypothetical protein
VGARLQSETAFVTDRPCNLIGEINMPEASNPNAALQPASPRKAGELQSSSQPAPGDIAPKGTPATGEAICPECQGTGKVDGQRCTNCDGSGKVVQGVGGG